MSIEARGGKHAYLYCYNATAAVGFRNMIHHSISWDVADSDDEAYGRAMKIALAAFPPEDGWNNHYVMTKKVSDIGWVGRFDLDSVNPVEFPA